MGKEKILIATKNKDKFDIINRILNKIDGVNYKCYSLYDINNFNKDDKESGDIKERAYKKANQIHISNKKEKFKYIVGIDDGIKIKGVLTEDIKKYIKDIIEDKYLKEGEQIEIVRAYCFMREDGSYETIVTEIPFKYKRIDSEIEIKENTYPLSNVLMPVDCNEVVAKMSKEENNNYYLKYSEKKIKEVLKNDN